MKSITLVDTIGKILNTFGTQGHWAVTSGIRWWWSSSNTLDTHTYCRALSSGVVTTCFYSTGLSQIGLEHPTFRLRGERSNHLRHRRGCILVLPIWFTAWDSIYDKICWYMYFSLSSKEFVSHTTATSVARKTLGWIVNWKTSIVTESKAPVSTRT